ASLRAAPPLPAEGVATLGVARHLMVRESIPGLMSNRLVHALLDAKRALSGQNPALAQMGAPDLEADAVVRVHSGSRVLFQGEERSLLALAMEWIYAIPLLLGLVGTLVMGIVRWLRPGKAPALQRFVGESLSLRRRAVQATSLAEINATRHAFDRLMAEFEEQGGTGPITAQSTAALTALDLCERQIASRRADLDRVAALTGRPV
ncbi:MAG TPA: hypothetical protein PLQ11_09055, partial [Beijerinckiaceae bacterium]|nr:hypothetical protein [Beijerinckiaceae bacterium]